MSTGTATALENTVTLAKVGQPAPDFNMPSTKNMETLAENVKLSDYAGKWLILLFYPLDFTFVCPTELTAFSDRLEEINGVGAEVIGVSTDSVHSHKAWIKTPRASERYRRAAIPARVGRRRQAGARLQYPGRRGQHRAARPVYHQPGRQAAIWGGPRSEHRTLGR